MAKYSSGVLYGEELMALYNDAKENNFALPAVNVIGTDTANAALEAAAEVKSPIIIQASNGGAQFFAGKGMPNDNLQANIAGGVSMALHVHNVAKYYGVPVILHTDHAARKWLPWVDGLLTAGEAYKKEKGVPLFSSHMIDLSEEPLHEIISSSLPYLKRTSALGMSLEVEFGVTGGEEDGVDNSGVENHLLYSQPEEIWEAYEAFSKITNYFTIAAAFGNVHGVYSPGNVSLHPEILDNSQKFIAEKLGLAAGSKPVYFVFHGGSGSDKAKISQSLQYGVIKMNIDTDTQWAFWDGILEFYKKNHDYLQAQLGNPTGADAPNKKHYDPRVWLREAEKSFTKRLVESFHDLNAINRNA